MRLQDKMSRVLLEDRTSHSETSRACSFVYLEKIILTEAKQYTLLCRRDCSQYSAAA